MILLYEMRRRSGETWSLKENACLCERHVEARKVLGWVVDGAGKVLDVDPRFPVTCTDCETAKQPALLDRAMEASDAEFSDDPTPVPVLRGQGKLF
jgi:hypothetical protein